MIPTPPAPPALTGAPAAPTAPPIKALVLPLLPLVIVPPACSSMPEASDAVAAIRPRLRIVYWAAVPPTRPVPPIEPEKPSVTEV
jgi:hypothetical protein